MDTAELGSTTVTIAEDHRHSRHLSESLHAASVLAYSTGLLVLTSTNWYRLGEQRIGRTPWELFPQHFPVRLHVILVLVAAIGSVLAVRTGEAGSGAHILLAGMTGLLAIAPFVLAGLTQPTAAVWLSALLALLLTAEHVHRARELRHEGQ